METPATQAPVTEWDADGKPIQSSGTGTTPAATEWDADGNPITAATGTSEGNTGAPPPDKPGMTPLDTRTSYGSSLGDVASTVGSHLKNMVAGPVEALAEPPQNTGEKVADSLAGP